MERGGDSSGHPGRGDAGGISILKGYIRPKRALRPSQPKVFTEVFHGTHVSTLNDLIARIVASDELRVHLDEVSHERYDEVGRDHFDSVFKLSDQLVVIPRHNPPLKAWPNPDFPWYLGIAPIDYQSRLEAELTKVWGGFEDHDDDYAVVGEVDGIEIRRSVTVYRRLPTA